MPFSFPASPTVGQQSTQNGRVYQWTGTAWELVATPAAIDGAAITTGTVSAARLGTHATAHNPGGSDPVSLCQIFEFTRTTRPAAATGSNGSYTFSLPAGARVVEFLLIGGGAGGGSGRRGAAGSTRFGGGGGGGANATIGTMNASAITTAITVNVGAGGAGGAAVTTDNTNGNGGSLGNSSTVVFNGSTTLAASTALAGGGGTDSAGTAGGGFSNETDTWRNSQGGSAGSAFANASAPLIPAGYAATGGAGGGGITGGGVTYSGGTVNARHSQVAVTGLWPTNPTGGAASTTAAGGDGSDGPNYGFGGCGGGASQNGFNSGRGGNGGNGYVRITVWF